MEITDIRIRRTFEDQPLKAILSVTFDDCLVLHDVKIVHAREKYFVVMPSRRLPDGTFRDIVHPTKQPFRVKLENALLEKYFDETRQPIIDDMHIEFENRHM